MQMANEALGRHVLWFVLIGVGLDKQSGALGLLRLLLDIIYICSQFKSQSHFLSCYTKL